MLKFTLIVKNRMNIIKLNNFCLVKNVLSNTLTLNNLIVECKIASCLGLSRFYSNTKRPSNKVFNPSTVAVTKANSHLDINLFDEANLDLGKLSMDAANKLAQKKELKLVITDESCTPPKFKLMDGTELYRLQMSYRESNKDLVKDHREKEIDMKLGIDEHDLQIKLKMASNFHEKGHLVKIKIRSSISRKWVHLFCDY